MMDTPDTEKTALDSLYRISSLILKTDDPKFALQLVLDEIVRVLRPSSASISLINPDSNRLELEVSYGLPEHWSDLDLALGQGITGWTALHGRSIIVPDVREEPRYICIQPEIRSEMAVPMEDRSMIIGVVNVNSAQVNAFGNDALKILTLLTNEATRGISRLWLIKQLRTKANQLESLISVGQGLVGELDTERILDRLANEGRQLLDCHCCALFLRNPDQQELHLHSMTGPDGQIRAEESIRIDHSALSAAIHRKKQVEVTDLNFTEENAFLHTIQREGLTSMLASPICFGDEVIGVLSAYTLEKHRFNDNEKKVFATLTGLGAIAIQNARLYSRVFATEESLRRNEKLTTLGMLAAEIAHEIRNPLTVIKLLFGSLNLDFSEQDERKTDLRVIDENLDHLEEIVERVLCFGRSRSGMHTRQDLSHLIQDTIRLVRLKLHQQKIELHFESEHPAIPVEVNKGQIQQVLLNLILNATQAMPQGGAIWINIKLSGGNAELEIRDNGQGIPAHLHEEIFESFLTDRPYGTGLGLSISKRILRSHRGDIELLHSEPGNTCFRIWIPHK